MRDYRFHAWEAIQPTSAVDMVYIGDYNKDYNLISLQFIETQQILLSYNRVYLQEYKRESTEAPWKNVLQEKSQTL